MRMKQNNLEIRQLQSFKNKENIVEGYALKFNKPSKDLGGFVEYIDARALDGVDMSDVKLFLNHDSTNLLGRTKSGTLQLSVDDVGLKFRCEMPNTTLGNDVLELVKRGDLSQCSFGFTVAEDSWERREGQPTRTIKKINTLAEISLVSIPAYDDTDVTVAQRSLETMEVNEFEKRKLELELQLRLATL